MKPILPGTPEGKTDRLPEFDILRSIAILLLFLHHGGIYRFSVLDLPLSPLDTYVGLFLLGSFVFMAGYLSVRSLQKGSLIDFLKTKLLRVYIPYLVALIVFVLFLEVEVDKVDLSVHVLGAQMILSPRLTSPIMTLWFVGLILAYYVIFAVLQKGIRSSLWLAIAGVLIFVAAFLVRSEWELVTRRFFYYFFVYLAGVLFARGGWLQRVTSARYYLLDKVLLALLGVAVFTPYRQLYVEDFSLGMVLAANGFILSMVLLTLSFARVLVPRMPLRIFSFISFSSFFAYLFHRPIWKLLWELYTFQSETLMFLYIVLLGGALVLLVSYLLQRVYNLTIGFLFNHV